MENNNFNQNTQSQFNQQYSQYGQPQYNQQQYSQTNQYGQSMNPNMYNQQQIYQSTQNLDKSGNKIIALIIAGIITLMLTVGIILVLLFSVVAKPKDAIKEHLIEDYLYENNIDYYDYETAGIEYGEGTCYDTYDDFSIYVLECESENEAVKEFREINILLLGEDNENGYSWSFSTNAEGSNYEKKIRYSSDAEVGAYLIRVDETVLYIDAYTEDAWDTVKDMMDELNY